MFGTALLASKHSSARLRQVVVQLLIGERTVVLLRRSGLTPEGLPTVPPEALASHVLNQISGNWITYSFVVLAVVGSQLIV